MPAAASRIRWDRIARAALLAMLAVVLLLYVNPLRSYFETWQTAKEKRGEVAELRAENERLRERQSALRDPRTLEQEARRLGMLRPGERGFVLRGLPAD